MKYDIHDLLGVDPEGAELIAERSPNNCSRSHELLYRSKHGSYYLLYDEEGCSTPFDEEYRDVLEFLDEGVLLSTAAALNWCEKNGISAETIMQYFDIEEA